MCTHSYNCTNAPLDAPCGQLRPVVLLMLFSKLQTCQPIKIQLVKAVKQMSLCYYKTVFIAVGDFTSLNIGVNVTNKDLQPCRIEEAKPFNRAKSVLFFSGSVPQQKFLRY